MTGRLGPGSLLLLMTLAGLGCSDDGGPAPDSARVDLASDGGVPDSSHDMATDSPQDLKKTPDQSAPDQKAPDQKTPDMAAVDAAIDGSAADSTADASGSSEGTIADLKPGDLCVGDAGDGAPCGGGALMGACSSAVQPATKAEFTMVSKAPTGPADTATVESRHYLGANGLTEQRCREGRTVGGTATALLNRWLASSPTIYQQWVLVPIPLGPAVLQFSPFTSFNCLFPTYAEKLRACLDKELTTCLFPEFQATTQQQTIDGKSCRIFNVAGNPQVTVCIPIDCQLRSTLYPLQTAAAGATITYQGLKVGTFVDSRVATP